MSNIRFSPYRSNTEQAWAMVGQFLIADKFNATVKWWSYEAIRLALGNAWYTPDFIYWLSDGRVVLVEVKGSKKQKGYRDSRTRQRVATGLFPLFVFVEALYAGNRNFNLEIWENKRG
ncbi:hypothetical protein JXJ21_03235 [candidate division KSB1 bacterium]|nr:hypothetical protein [candidate division KSB1 bacterium]